MIRLILRALNAPLFILIFTLAIAVQTSVFAAAPLSYFQPDVILIGVIWCAIHRTFTEGGVVTLLLAAIAEIHTSSTRGLLLITYMGVYLVIRALTRVIHLPRLTSAVSLTLFMSCLSKLLLLATVSLLDHGKGLWRHTVVFLAPGALAEGLLATFAYRWLDRLDWLTFKNPKAWQLGDDELPLETET